MVKRGILADVATALLLVGCQSPPGARNTEVHMPDRLTLKNLDLGQHFMVSNPPSKVLKQYKITDKNGLSMGPDKCLAIQSTSAHY